ncbi:TetR/AcrR family transcriptional regulator [Streptomyces sp. WAC05374]|uniref:TetR/AcrR family transcriptional regulator n=1 Tax=Streptomyces sp. WAC05374 TaxID=2487420 RepID=UPI000F897397|nr:TetR/AcrR family transcriptional regulator [Streptomyces sp. WAC05374]RST16299.1 TetR/AcrR family transcriptional regulator [Streptomyces sp. WAC05374]TDF38782.1 TetR/AcrR family transcriptional regulator [Streptomyces sp. WAC05374]TDF45536.1 TetR/AcrR family transcriptional regulator [Streptomyces sp. WAC05374]TDF56536.1 TetR/AcrR family transcriptional regulator [Streptomyces sp. WAC05374]
MESARRTSVWLEGKSPRARKADQPSGLDRERITEAAVRLLDAEGLAKFSMRKLAAELDVTAMSVYWYVDTKDDLLELALDRVVGELAPDPGPGTDWRERLRALATSYRGLFVAHPWMSSLLGHFLNIGPHSLDFARRAQQVVADTGLPLHLQTGAMASVFQFVYGFGTIEGHFRQRCAEAGMSQDEYFAHAMGSIREQPGYARTFEHAERMMEARGGDTVAEMRDRDFRFALEIQIAGIEAMVDRAAESRPDGSD